MYKYKPLPPKQNKALLIISIVLIVISLVLVGVNIYFKQWLPAIAMFLVLLSSIYNASIFWKQLKRKR